MAMNQLKISALNQAIAGRGLDVAHHVFAIPPAAVNCKTHVADGNQDKQYCKLLHAIPLW
jgi:hypothetical protein